jgi:hypothetical protein
MTKRLLLPGYLILLMCFTMDAAQAYPQDTTKKAIPEKKASIKSATPPKVKPPYHNYHKTVPAGNPATAANANDSSQINSLKTQIDPSQLNDKSLHGQYQYLLTKTFHYQQPLVTALWKNFTDTLNLERRQLKEVQATLATQNKKVTSLQADVTSKDQTLSESNAKVDAISLFGLLLPKATYNLIMFGSVAALALALVIVIITTAKYKHEAKHRIELYEEIDEEYKNFKAKANDKEKKLARELQTERNKLDELLGRG